LILFELTGSEQHPAYQALEISNGERHYSFLQSIVSASLEVGRPSLSQYVLKAINYHAIACLHTNAGEYRPCEVVVGTHTPPQHFRVAALMDDFVNMVNRQWEREDPVALAAFVLWRLNYIHPFINGNGRTARAASYFVLCMRAGGWLEGDVILPELIRQNRAEHVEALRLADQSYASGKLDLSALHALLVRLLKQQIEANGTASGQ
jgi:fido (protein-threonine AMPylation protein)